MKRHPEAVMAAKVGGYRLPPGFTWDDIARARAKYNTDPRLFPVAAVPGVATAWGVPAYAPTERARCASLLAVAAHARAQIGADPQANDWRKAGAMVDALWQIMRARRLRLTGFEHEKGASADHQRAKALLERLLAREMGPAAFA